GPSAGGDDLGEGPAFEVGHGEEEGAADLADVVDGAEVGVVDGGGGAGLAEEALARLRAVAGGEGGDLEGDAAVELRVVRQVDRPHAALAQEPEQAVAAEGGGQRPE